MFICYEGLGTVRTHTGSPKANWAHQVGQLCYIQCIWSRIKLKILTFYRFSLKNMLWHIEKMHEKGKTFHFERRFVSEILN